MLCCTVLGLALGVAAQPAHAEAPETDGLKISLITFGRGQTQVNEYFGHDALVVESPDLPEAVVYNYGMFSFGPDMIAKFLRGRLEFWVGATELRATTRSYARMNRDVRLRTLNLEPDQKRMVFRQLVHDALPENRVYLYDHYHDNCATRVRDVLDRALGGQLRRAWMTPSRFTLRDQTRRYTNHDPLMQWLMMFGLNDEVDRPMARWDDDFLPDELERNIDALQIVNHAGQRVPFVIAARSLFTAKPAATPVALTTGWPYTLGLGGLVALIGLSLAQLGAARAFAGFAALVEIAFGLLGSLLSLIWAFSDHVITYRNENILLANPLMLLAAGLSVAVLCGSKRAERWLLACMAVLAAGTALLCALKLLVPAFDQDVSLTATLLAPINLGLAWSSYVLGARRPATRFASSREFSPRQS